MFETNKVVSQLKAIFKQYGSEILKKSHDFVILLGDYLREHQKELHILRDVYGSLGIGEKLYAKHKSSEREQRAVASELHRTLQDYGKADEAAKFALDSVMSALGWNFSLASPESSSPVPYNSDANGSAGNNTFELMFCSPSDDEHTGSKSTWVHSVCSSGTLRLNLDAMHILCSSCGKSACISEWEADEDAHEMCLRKEKGKGSYRKIDETFAMSMLGQMVRVIGHSNVTQAIERLPF